MSVLVILVIFNYRFLRGKIECFGPVYMELYVKKENMKSLKYRRLATVPVTMFLRDLVKVT